VKNYPYHFHVALDGNGLNGLEGLAGVCQFLFDPESNTYAWKIAYFDGIAGGHAVSLNAEGTLGFLGNTGQHLLLYDARDSREVARQSTLSFEANDTSIRGSTHAVWLSEHEFVTAIGDFFYRFDARRPRHGERIGLHGVKLPHAIKRTSSGRWLVYGSMDHPRHGEAREVGIFDLETGASRRIELPATCWHVAAAPENDLFYALSFRVLPQEGRDWHEWAMAYMKEYAFEIDAGQGQVLRHWAAGREVPAHINSDVVMSRSELIFCTGASQTILMIDREGFARWRMIDERPDFATAAGYRPELARQVSDALTRGNLLRETRHFLSALRISRFAVLDSVYACQLSRDERFLFTANRGLNHITVYDYPSNQVRLRVAMPPLQQFVPWAPAGDRRLGFHHGALLDRTERTGAVVNAQPGAEA
jgi:hypothetical protein